MLFGAQVRQAGGLLAALRRAEAMGAVGAGLDAYLDRLADGMRRALDAAGGRLLLENTAGAGGTIGRSFEELARVLEHAGGDPRLGVCVDTQHLWASGVPFRTLAEADAAVAGIDASVGLDRLACVHANDSKVGLGANLDRHENPGEGAIGDDGFRCLLGHPALQGLPAVLEVPGVEGRGPSSRELAAIRRLHAEGLALRLAADQAGLVSSTSTTNHRGSLGPMSDPEPDGP